MISPEMLQRQNADGGWSYRSGSSWTEPTCYALLALSAAGMVSSEAAIRGAKWLSSRQRGDGGWAPRDGVDQSTWVTSLALLLPRALVADAAVEHATPWLLQQTGRESGMVHRLRMLMLGISAETKSFDGWPWFPGAAAWVTPTALTILALKKLPRAESEPIASRIEEGTNFLLARRCRDGGWNHGSTHALGYDSGSYPETTGIALLALHDSKAPEIAGAEAVAERDVETCRSSEGASWLTMALLARGRAVHAVPPAPHDGSIELALGMICDAARQGRNVFLS